MEFLARLDELYGGEEGFNIRLDLFPRNENQFDVFYDDDDAENYIFELERRQYRMYVRISYMEIWNEDEFFNRFRLSKSTVAYILSLIEPQLQPKDGYLNRYVKFNLAAVSLRRHFFWIRLCARMVEKFLTNFPPLLSPNFFPSHVAIRFYQWI